MSPIGVGSVQTDPSQEPGSVVGGSETPQRLRDDDWRAVSDGVGELHIFCPECWEREFG